MLEIFYNEVLYGTGYGSYKSEEYKLHIELPNIVFEKRPNARYNNQLRL